MNCWLIFWFGQDHFENIFNLIQLAGKPDNISPEVWISKGMGFKTRRTPGIWSKGNGQTSQPDIYLANDYEMFFYARKGQPIINKKGHGNIFTYAPVTPSKKKHPTERPIEMIQDIIEIFAGKGVCFVPFLGSGNTLKACYNLGISAFGYDLSNQYRERFLEEIIDADENKVFRSYGK